MNEKWLQSFHRSETLSLSFLFLFGRSYMKLSPLVFYSQKQFSEVSPPSKIDEVKHVSAMTSPESHIKYQNVALKLLEWRSFSEII